MMALIVVVMAIALSALVVFGGVSYYSHDIGVRTETAAVVRANYEALVSGVLNYKSVNNGLMPENIEQLAGFLPNGKIPQFPKYSRDVQPYQWKIEGDHLCLYRTPSNQINVGIDRGIWTFADALSRSQTIKVDANCVDAAHGTATTESVGFNYPYLASRPSIALVFKVN